MLVLLCNLLSRSAAAEELIARGNVSALASDGQRLFVGMFDQGLIEVRREGGSRAIGSTTLDPNVNALAIDPALHALWVGTARGLARCTLSDALCVRVGGRGSIHALLLLHEGTLLAGGEAGLLAVSREGELRLLDRKGGAPFRAVWSLAEAQDGTVFVGTSNGLHFASLEGWFERAGARARVGMVTGDLQDDWVTALSIVHTTLWVGTYHAGVSSFAFARGKLTRGDVDSALGYVNPAGLLALDDGTLAVATMEGLRVGTHDTFRSLPTADRDVTAVLRAASGRYWVGSRTGVELFELLAEP
ncbi:MAG: hypothetical protein JWN04_1525 [Myxococcaceae bacterium]|nr:hypothetical protein [Myxococcaceae bacterium]